MLIDAPELCSESAKRRDVRLESLRPAVAAPWIAISVTGPGSSGIAAQLRGAAAASHDRWSARAAPDCRRCDTVRLPALRERPRQAIALRSAVSDIRVDEIWPGTPCRWRHGLDWPAVFQLGCHQDLSCKTSKHGVRCALSSVMTITRMRSYLTARGIASRCLSGAGLPATRCADVWAAAVRWKPSTVQVTGPISRTRVPALRSIPRDGDSERRVRTFEAWGRHPLRIDGSRKRPG